MVGLQLQPPGFDRPYVVRLRPQEQNNKICFNRFCWFSIERLNEQSAAGIDLLAGTTQTKVLAVWPLQPVRGDDAQGYLFLLFLFKLKQIFYRSMRSGSGEPRFGESPIHGSGAQSR
jgi:hypothetical protein